MKVLIADDDPDFVVLVKTFLEAQGCRIVVAQDTMRAAMLARREGPDVVLLDVNMPGGGGIGTLKQLKASTKFGAIPVVVISARDDEELPRTAAELGAARFIRKPVDLETMHRTLLDLVAAPAPGR